MTARIIDGKAVAARLRGEVAEVIRALEASHDLTPGLAVVLVGEDPAGQVYVRNKEAAAAEAGVRSVSKRLPADTTQDALLDLIWTLNADPRVHGILVQLPLPAHIDERAILSAVDPDKDVDGFHVVNAGRLSVNLPGLRPCTPEGCMILLRQAVPDLAGARAVVLGRSNIVGKPMAQLLLLADCTVTVAHSRSRDLPALCREADVLVAAVGRPEMVRGDWIKPGATVIDVGINRLPSGDPDKAAAGKTRLVGDVAYAEALEVAGAITPVPGGVGPMTIACLLRNTVIAAGRSVGVDTPLD